MSTFTLVSRPKHSLSSHNYANETALLYQMLLHRTLSLKGELCSGRKHSKVRVAVLLRTNEDQTEELPPLVIEKSASLLCFKGKRRLKLQYLHDGEAL